MLELLKAKQRLAGTIGAVAFMIISLILVYLHNTTEAIVLAICALTIAVLSRQF